MKKVLVVDDSALMRKLLTGVLESGGWTVQTARHGNEAVARVLEWQPDVITLDINMPEMDGLTALSLIMAARPTPVVMVSSLTEHGALATFEALALGAVDFIPKPGGTISLKVDDIAPILLEKVRCAARARVGGRLAGMAKAATRTPRPASSAPAVSTSSEIAPRATGVPAEAAAPSQPARLQRPPAPGLVLVGVSTGGPRTLEDILPYLPADFPWPVLVAQHMPASFTDTFARRMDSLCALEVVEVATPMALEAGRVYIGRGGTDLTVSDRGGRLFGVPRPEAAGVLWHPSVEILVETAMQHVHASRLMGVMLTGMGNDGAAAMARLKVAGGRTIAESADTAVVFGMPHELIERQGASVILPCHQIAAQMRHWASTRSTGASARAAEPKGAC